MMWIAGVGPQEVFEAILGTLVALVIFGIPLARVQQAYSPIQADAAKDARIDWPRVAVVLSILSTSVRTGRAFTVPSAIAKSGVQAMTRSLAVEWGPKGIRLVAIAPGPFPTPGASKQLLPEERTKQATPASRNPLGRVGEPIELSNLAAYLLSPLAGYITGETIAIDGAAHLRTSGAEDLLGWTEAQWEALRAKR